MTVDDAVNTVSDPEALITPSSLSEYLAANRWAIVRESRGVAQLWAAQSGTGKRQILIPLDPSYVDYSQRLDEAITDAAKAFDLGRGALTEAVVRTRTDIFLVRLDQETRDGTIPFEQAKTALNSIERMVRAAATVAESPAHSGLGRRPRRVVEFMKDELRFGQTRKGSFILTVAARLGETGSQAATPESAPTGSDKDAVAPFTRRVMETLAHGVNATKEYVSDGPTGLDLEHVLSQGARVDLVQSIIDLVDTEGVQSLDMSFQWANSYPEDDSTPSQTVITRAELPEVVSLRDRLVRVLEPTEVTLIGRVKALTRDGANPAQEDHSIVLEAEVESRMRNVKVPLTRADYEWAIFAHQRRLLFTVTGKLVKRRSWELDGNVTADVTFLEHVQGMEIDPTSNEE